MPAPVPSSLTTRIAGKHSSIKPRTTSHPNKTRIVRRRGRAKGAIESDDEIEREAGTDSDSDDDRSSIDSASDSHAESPPRHRLPNGRSQPSTPSTTQSLEEPNHPVIINGDDESSFFGGATGNWSEMVADENANGPADLPVIEFADFDRHGMHQHSRSSRSRKAQKMSRKPPFVQPTPVAAPVSVPSAPSSARGGQDELDRSEHSVASSSRRPLNGSTPKRPLGQTARQAYQQRLETDPSYVPTLGEFWGHDDRLLDKDLRSLSGWWRGRWQGRGRGRGGFDRGVPARGRGRGVFFGNHSPSSSFQEVPEKAGRNSETPSEPPPDVAAIEQAWTHDGFEEMKRRDEHHRAQERPNPQPFRGLGSFRGGRGSFGRGRGGFHRGSSTRSPSRSHTGLPFVHPIGRLWFAMKPERMWTKQHDAFLHFDPAMKPRLGQGPAFRVKLPGDQVQIVRAPLRDAVSTPQTPAKPRPLSIFGSEDGEKIFVVRIPQRNETATEKAKLSPDKAVPVEEPIRTAVEPPIDDIFTVRPRLVERKSLPVNGTLASSDAPQGVHSVQTNHADPALSSILPAQQQLEKLSMERSQTEPANPLRWSQTEEAVMRHPPTEARIDNQQESSTAQARPSHAVLPPLQTGFVPASRNSPSFGSPFTYGPTLPPGIAMNQHGMPYELATGRAVYLQPPPPPAPPPPMYNPRPIMHSHIPSPNVFVPGHMHHHSTASPDFLPQPPSHTPPVNGFLDPSSGTPIFSLPRSSRIEIRAPSDQSDGKTPGKSFARRPSGLRTTAAAFQPVNSGDGGQGYFADEMGATFPSEAADDREPLSEDGQAAQNQRAIDTAVMAYPFYQHQYYYPEAYSYPSYMDLSQVAPYEMYTPDPRASQSTVYY